MADTMVFTPHGHTINMCGYKDMVKECPDISQWSAVMGKMGLKLT
jgi:hypothetical protein